MAKHSNRRRIIVIDKKFQIRFAAYMCGWLVALCFIYPFIVKNLFDYFYRLTAHDPLGPDLQNLMQVRTEVITLLILTEVAFLLMTFLMVVFISHRIAGPLYKLRKTFAEFGAGEFKHQLKFREKDYFQIVAEDFNTMAGQLRERTRHEAEMVAVVISRMTLARDQGSEQVKAELDPALTILRTLQAQQLDFSTTVQPRRATEGDGSDKPTSPADPNGNQTA
jgi:methyl-accepting chemotaxis protein